MPVYSQEIHLLKNLILFSHLVLTVVEKKSYFVTKEQFKG